MLDEKIYYIDEKMSKERTLDFNTRTIIILMSTFFMLIVILPSDRYGVKSQYTPENEKICSRAVPAITHATIELDGNNALDAFCVVGIGTEANPYIIENFEIDASSGAGILISNTDAYLTIRDCTIFGDSEENFDGIRLNNCENVVISGNNCTANSYTGINLIFAYSVNVSGNLIATSIYGIRISATCSNNIISDNSVINNNCGIDLYFAHNNTILSNNCSENRWIGISVEYDSQDNNITNNIASNNGEYGIFLTTNSANNTISNNSFENNFNGIFLFHTNDNNITGNFCSGSENAGICLDHANGNKISSNKVINNPHGLFLNNTSSANIIWSNLFYDNTYWQVYCTDDGINNLWYYIDTGNYYGDYLNLFPTATNDGRVWDIPYYPWESGVDLYPLFYDRFPTWEIVPVDQVVVDIENFLHQINAFDELGISQYWLNDSTIFSINETGHISNISIIQAGIYNIEVFVNDTLGQEISGSFSIFVLDKTLPKWTIGPTNQIIPDDEQFYYQTRASDNVQIDQYWLNDTSIFSIVETGLILNTTSLEIGNYYLQVFVSDTNGNEISAEISITVYRETGSEDGPSDEDPQDQGTRKVSGYPFPLFLGITGIFLYILKKRPKKII